MGSRPKWSAPEVLRGLSSGLRQGRVVVVFVLEGSLFLLVSLDPGQQVLEVGRGELPSEGPGGRVVTPLEGDEPVFDLVKTGEIVGSDDLALDDGEEVDHPGFVGGREFCEG
jgi:hypothetical protein